MGKKDIECFMSQFLTFVVRQFFLTFYSKTLQEYQICPLMIVLCFILSFVGCKVDGSISVPCPISLIFRSKVYQHGDDVKF